MTLTMLRRGLIALAAVLLAAETRGQAQAPNSWVGRKVVVKDHVNLRLGNRVVDTGGVHRVYTVDAAQGSWLRLASGGVSGWVKVGEVIPFERALDYYTAEVSKSPKSPSAYFHRGLIRADLGDLDRAIADFTEAVRLDPKNTTAYLARGTCRQERGELDRAIADFTEAIRLDPSFVPAYGTRGRAWLDKKEYQIALTDYTEVIRLRPWSFQAYLDRGIAWDRKGEFDLAIADFNESLRREPKNPYAYINRGNAWRSKKDYDKAIADYGEALKLDPGSDWTYINRGLAWAAKGEYDRAVADHDRALRLDPGNPAAYNNRAIFRERQGDYGRAIADFEEALRFDPKFQDARAALALLLASCPDAVYRDGKRALALATEAEGGAVADNPLMPAALAAAYAETGDFRRAVEWQEKALRLMPESGEKDEHRARLKLYQEQKPYRQVTPKSPG